MIFQRWHGNVTLMFLLFLGGLNIPSTYAWPPFPDPATFQGIETITVGPVSFINMEIVKLHPETLRVGIQTQLREAGISVTPGNTLQAAPLPGATSLHSHGALSVLVRRWETSGPMGTTLNSFAISIRFFQLGGVSPSRKEAWVITWLETKSVLVGTSRPKGIEKAVEELVAKFIKDFKANPSK